MIIEKTVVQMAKEVLEKSYTHNMAVASSNLCVHCGMCIDQCHYPWLPGTRSSARWPRSES